MLIVDHNVRPSEIHGLGVFAKEPIKAGTVVWRFDPMFDVELPEEFVSTLASEDLETVLHHAEYMPDKRVFRLGNDADIFMNHSNRPSLVDRGDEMVAARDLRAGEELTCDYCEVRVVGFDAETAYRLAAE